MKYNLSRIMKRAHELFKKFKKALNFAECLRRSWASEKAKPINAARIAEAKAAAGIPAEIDTDTYTGFKARGFEVIHGMKCLFQVELIHASKGANAIYKASFFSIDQVQPIQAAA